VREEVRTETGSVSLTTAAGDANAATAGNADAATADHTGASTKASTVAHATDSAAQRVSAAGPGHDALDGSECRRAAHRR